MTVASQTTYEIMTSMLQRKNKSHGFFDSINCAAPDVVGSAGCTVWSCVSDRPCLRFMPDSVQAPKRTVDLGPYIPDDLCGT